MTTRTEIINYFIKNRSYESYLEIGVADGQNFNAIDCKHKTGVDPDTKAKASVFMTSDQFFKKNYFFRADLIFIDGLHIATQVYKDIMNSLDCLKDGGMILLHDMVPSSQAAQQVPRIQGEWTGDCWMAFVWLRATREDLSMFTINTDYGVGVIMKGKQDLLEIKENLTYENLQRNKSQWLNLRHPALPAFGL